MNGIGAETGTRTRTSSTVIVVGAGPAGLLLAGDLLDNVGPARRKAAGQITGIGYRYPAPRGTHRLTGTRVPDVTLRGGRLYEALRGGRFVLITPEAYDDGGAHKDRLAVERWASNRRTTVLVRPDGYVAWAADSADEVAVADPVAAHVG